jgi:hypothetical protein
VIYVGCQNAITQKAWLVILPLIPIILIAGIIDFLFNQTIGRLMFLEWRYTFTFSERLDSHFLDTDWRGSVARDIGNAIDKILPGHIK